MSDRLRARVGWRLRRLADRIDYRGAPRSPGLSFTIETGRGLVIHQDGRGCPLWYLGEADHERAYSDADGAARAALIADQFAVVNARPGHIGKV